MDCANPTVLFVQVHESCLLDFLRDFEKGSGGLKILDKQDDLYSVQVFITNTKSVRYPKCQRLEDSGNEPIGE